ncbi:hypothetical protein Pelo_19592 [Pelomyxa schiedti]|nr:hypothetical protein Pelo_19592 [Pelomyxa schiedti]
MQGVSRSLVLNTSKLLCVVLTAMWSLPRQWTSSASLNVCFSPVTVLVTVPSRTEHSGEHSVMSVGIPLGKGTSLNTTKDFVFQLASKSILLLANPSPQVRFFRHTICNPPHTHIADLTQHHPVQVAVHREVNMPPAWLPQCADHLPIAIHNNGRGLARPVACDHEPVPPNAPVDIVSPKLGCDPPPKPHHPKCV